MSDCDTFICAPKRVKPSPKARLAQTCQPPITAPISPAESASYTAGMLQSLEKIALAHHQGILAHLLALAATEANMQANPHSNRY